MFSFTKKVYNFFCTISESEQSELKPCPHYFLKLVFKTSIKTSIIYIHIYNIIYIYIYTSSTAYSSFPIFAIYKKIAGQDTFTTSIFVNIFYL